MKEYNITNTFFPPTVLKMMRKECDNTMYHKLRSLGSGGESLGKDLLEWGKSVFDTTIAEFYGQTECNLIVSNSPDIFDVKDGYMGKPVPGHDVRVINIDNGIECETGEVGGFAVKYPDPVMFLEYWNMPDKTANKFVSNPDDDSKWMLTGTHNYVHIFNIYACYMFI